MNIVLHWPQITYIIVVILSLLIVAVKHGKPRENYSIFSYLLSAAVSIFLLVSGGFFG